MSFEELLSLLIYPLGTSIVLALISAVFICTQRLRAGASLAMAAFFWLTLWSLSPVADALSRSLEGQSVDRAIEKVPEADLILVFGGVMKPPTMGHPYANLGSSADRVWQAARLYHAGKAELVVLSGGRNNWQERESSQAAVMASFLRDLGVPDSAIILEERSRNTYENAVNCAEIMRRRGAKHALLITSALHMPRAKASMATTAMAFTAIATDFEVADRHLSARDWLPNVQALQLSTLALHEWIGIGVYRLRGWI